LETYARWAPNGSTHVAENGLPDTDFPDADHLDSKKALAALEFRKQPLQCVFSLALWASKKDNYSNVLALWEPARVPGSEGGSFPPFASASPKAPIAFAIHKVKSRFPP
jgi:hypothetical protein